MCNSSNVAVPRYSPGKALGHVDVPPSGAPSSLLTGMISSSSSSSWSSQSSLPSSSDATAFSTCVTPSDIGTQPPTTASITKRPLSIEELRGKDNLPASKLPFLIKLHTLLDDVERTGNEHIISWLSHGRSFKVHRPQSLMNVLAPVYFNQTKWKSFQRQLHLYEFARTPYGIEAGSYSHPNFVRGQPDLCLCLRPIKIKGQKKGEGRKVRLPVNIPHTAQPADAGSPQVQAVQRHEDEDEHNHHHQQQQQQIRPIERPDREQEFGITSIEHARWVAKIKSLVVNGASLASQLQHSEPSDSALRHHQQVQYEHDGDDQPYHEYNHQQQSMMMAGEDEMRPSFRTQDSLPFIVPSLPGFTSSPEIHSFPPPTTTTTSATTTDEGVRNNDTDNVIFCAPVAAEREGSPCAAFGSCSFNYLHLGHDVNRCNCCTSDDEHDDDDDDDDDDMFNDVYNDDANRTSAFRLSTDYKEANSNINKAAIIAAAADDDADFVQQILAAVQ